jgi:hypothetical protein
MCIQPNIWVDFGAQDVPEPSCDIGSARSVVDRISDILIGILSIPGKVTAGVGDGSGNGDGTWTVGIGLGGVLLGEALGAAVALGLAAGDVAARGLGLVGRIVMPGIGPMLMPGIGAIVDCADGAPVAGLGTITSSTAKPRAMPAIRKAAVS